MSLKYSILAMLSIEPKTGYQLSKDVQGSIGFFWKATHQQIYRELSALEHSGWVKYTDVTQSEKPDKKVFSITKTGLKELINWMKEPSEPPVTRDSFLIKLFVGHLIEPSSILTDLRIQKKAHEERQSHYKNAEEKYFKNVRSLSIKEQYMYLTLRRGILLGKAWLAWCREVEEVLQKK